MEKEKILQLIKKIKKAQSILQEVDSEIRTCNKIKYWHIYEIDTFKSICEILKIGYKTSKGKAGYTHFTANYNDLEICTCGVIKDE